MSRLQQLIAFLEASPGDSFLLFAVAKEYEGLGEEEQAFRYYREIMEKDPAYVGLYYHLGKWYERQKRFQEAFHTYGRGMDIAKQAKDEHAYSELAAAKMGLGDDEDFA